MSKADILIVEDDSIVAMDIRSRLKRLGYSVSGIVNYAEQAVEKAEACKPDLVLMDIVLKGKMDGIEAAEIISSRFDIAVVFLTAYTDRERFERAKHIMPYGYILKPFRERDLQNTIEIALHTAKINSARKQAEQKLVQLNKQLEEKVRKRTLELEGANEKLRTTAEELEASRAGFKSIVEQNASGIMVLNDNGVIQFINPAMQNQFRHYQLSVGNEFAIPTAWDERLEVKITRSENTIGTAEMFVLETLWENKPSYLLMLHDITETKEANIALENERSSLARANRLKDEFLANMSHELRTPLTAVLGMSEALIDEVYGDLNERQLKSLKSIESSGRHLLNLINDILDLSKIEAGQAELAIGQVYVQEVCQASQQMIKQIALKKKQTLSLTIDSRLQYIRADVMRLKQMLVNLLMNAVKFTPEGGKVGLEVEGIPEQGLAKFTVWDTGMGISQENIQKLFKPFVQVDGSYTRQHEGTGLGLALVYNLAEMHGGSVSVESEAGEYSRFMIMLPWQPDENLVNGKAPQDSENIADITPQPSEALTNSPQAKILMADDNKDNLETVGGYLKAIHYDLLIAYDGAEAVELTFEKRPDLILMDIQMPVMDGLEAIKEIRNWEIELRKQNPQSEIKRIPIIALTALAMPGDKEKCLEIGADEYISKPVGLKKLAELIKKFIAEI
ncbi:response regulator [Desulfococcaceae bacterium HSG7]|nr:response regulator [Desulfococcaceae bacterium HSG7]